MRTFDMTDDLTEFDRYLAYFGTDGLMQNFRDNAEQAMRNLGEPEFQIYRPELIDSYFPYSTRTDEQRSDYSIAMFAVAQNEHNYKYVPESLKNQTFNDMAFKLNARVVKYFSAEQMNYDRLKLVSKYKPELLVFMGIDSSKNVALTAVSLNPSIYLELDDKWKTDHEIISAAINKTENSNIKDFYYEKNIAYIQDVLKLTVTQEVEPTPDEKDSDRLKYKGPKLSMDTVKAKVRK